MTKTVEMPGQQALIDRSELPHGSVLAATDNPAAARIAWEQYAIPKVVEFALRPDVDTFQYAEAEAAMEILPPPDPAHDPGRLMLRMRGEGLLMRAGATESKKKTGNHSLLRLWRASEALRAKRGVA